MDWNINLISKDDAAGKDNNLGLVHVLTSENTDKQSYIDPRDNLKHYNVSYSFGINTVLFDISALQVKAVIPSIINYNESYTKDPTPAEISAAYA
jgi:protoporphyrinogen oxidase